MVSTEEVAQTLRSLALKYGVCIEPKPLQIEIMRKLLNSESVFGVLPTGYGKSYCFGWFSALLDEVS
jgi:superfamily II DNA helicase RecQ